MQDFRIRGSGSERRKLLEAYRGQSFGVNTEEQIPRRGVFRDGEIEARSGADRFAPLHAKRGGKPRKLRNMILREEHQIGPRCEEFRKFPQNFRRNPFHAGDDDAYRYIFQIGKCLRILKIDCLNRQFRICKSECRVEHQHRMSRLLRAVMKQEDG